MDQSVKFNELLNKSKFLAQNLDYFNALACLNNLISNDYQLPPEIIYSSYCLRGQIKFKLKDFKNSIKDFDTAIELNPSNHYLYQYRADSKQGIYLYTEALEDSDIAINLNPSDSYNFLKKGSLEFKLKNYKEALKNFDIVLKKDPINYCAIVMKEFALENLYQSSKLNLFSMKLNNSCSKFQIYLSNY